MMFEPAVTVDPESGALEPAVAKIDGGKSAGSDLRATGYCASCGTWDAHGRACLSCGYDFSGSETTFPAL